MSIITTLANLFAAAFGKQPVQVQPAPVAEVKAEPKPAPAPVYTREPKVYRAESKAQLDSLILAIGTLVLNPGVYPNAEPMVKTSSVRKGAGAGLAQLRRAECMVSFRGMPARKLVAQESNSWVFPAQAGMATAWLGDSVVAVVTRKGLIGPADGSAWDTVMSR